MRFRVATYVRRMLQQFKQPTETFMAQPGKAVSVTKARFTKWTPPAHCRSYILSPANHWKEGSRSHNSSAEPTEIFTARLIMVAPQTTARSLRSIRQAI